MRVGELKKKILGEMLVGFHKEYAQAVAYEEGDTAAENIVVKYAEQFAELLTTAKEEGREEERLFKVRLEDEIRQLKRRSDSSTYLYGQGESHAYEEVLKLLSPSIRKEEI